MAVGPAALDADRARGRSELPRERHGIRRADAIALTGPSGRASAVAASARVASWSPCRNPIWSSVGAGLLRPELARELAVEGREEVRVEHDARVAREHGVSVETDLSGRRIRGVVSGGHGGDRNLNPG